MKGRRWRLFIDAAVALALISTFAFCWYSIGYRIGYNGAMMDAIHAIEETFDRLGWEDAS